MSDTNLNVGDTDQREHVSDTESHTGDTIPSLDMDDLVGNKPTTVSSKTGSGVTWLESELNDEDVAANSVLVPKHKRGDHGTREYLRYIDAATYPLDPKMGVPSHFVSSLDGETEEGNQTKNLHIQEVFASNLEKVDQAHRRAETYDMMGIFDVPSVRDKHASKPAKLFNMGDCKNMFVHWDSMSWDDICLWQKAVNKWSHPDDRTSSHWAQSFLYKSSTQALRERVDSQYKGLPATFKGGVTYLYLQLKIMFHISRDTINALKKFI